MIAYYYTYWAICFSILTLLIFYGLFFDAKRKYNKAIDNIIFFLLVVFATLYFGFRSEEIGTDTSTYLNAFRDIVRFDSIREIFESELAIRDPFFYSYVLIVSNVVGPTGFLFITSILYITPVAFVFFKLFKRDKAYAFIFFLMLDVSVNMGINIIRTGLGMSFSLLFMYYFVQKKNPLLCTLFALVAIGFHQSSIIIIGIFLLVRFIKAPLIFYYIILLSSFILSFFKIGIVQLPIIGDFLITNERFSSYSDQHLSSDVTGMSLFIMIFFGLTIGLIYLFRKKLVVNNLNYDFFF